jgi:hypothetical protein
MAIKMGFVKRMCQAEEACVTTGRKSTDPVFRYQSVARFGLIDRRAQEPNFEPAVKRRPRGSKQDGHALWRCSSSVHDRALSRPKKATRGHFVFFLCLLQQRRDVAPRLSKLMAWSRMFSSRLMAWSKVTFWKSPLLVARALGVIHVLEHDPPVAGFQPRLAARSLNQERNGLTITSQAQQRGRLLARATGPLVALALVYASGPPKSVARSAAASRPVR